LSSVFKRLREAFRPSPIGAKASETLGARVPFQQTLHKLAEAKKFLTQPTAKVTPAIPFSDVLAAYFADTACKAASHELAFSAVGKGLYHTVDPDYEKADEVEKLIDEFNEKANLDALLVVAAVEIAAAGNHFWLIGDIDMAKKKLLDVERPIKPIPLVSIESAACSFLSDQVKVLDKIQAYNLWSYWGGGQLNPERIVHFRWNPVNASIFGYGIIQSLLEEGSFDGETRKCYLEMKWRIEQRMIDIHEKYAGPDQMWWMPKAKSDDVTKLQSLLKSRPKEGARFVWSGEKGGEIFTVSLDPRARFDFYVDHIMNQNYLGLETPLAKALTTPGFTEASIRGAIELHEPVIFTMQRFIKREVEKLWSFIITEAGYDPIKAHARLNWGPPGAPDMEQLATLMPHFVRLVELAVITPPQMREILRTVFNLKMIEEPAEAAPEGVEAVKQKPKARYVVEE